MKILTKKWVEKHEQVKLAFRLKVCDAQTANYEEIKNKSVNDFLANLKRIIFKLCKNF